MKPDYIKLTIEAESVEVPRLRSFSKPKLPNIKKNSSHPTQSTTPVYVKGNTGASPDNHVRATRENNEQY